MLSFLNKNLHLCISKLKTTTNIPIELTSNDLTSTSTCLSDDISSSESDSDGGSVPPDFSSVYASQRFFFSSPGPSNSIFRSHEPDPLFAGGVPTWTDSPDPYADFRQSMQEMVDAKGHLDVRTDWNWLQELLLCYLALNPKYTHKYITDAFADLVFCLISSKSDPHCRNSE